MNRYRVNLTGGGGGFSDTRWIYEAEWPPGEGDFITVREATGRQTMTIRVVEIRPDETGLGHLSSIVGHEATLTNLWARAKGGSSD